MKAQTWLIVVTAISSFVSCGFAVQGFLTSSSDPFAGYALARSVPLACAGAYILVNRSASVVQFLAVIMIAVQALDCLVGFQSNNALKTFGPLLTAVANLILLYVVKRPNPD